MRGALHVPGHFGEWLQGRLGPAGPVALITLPCAALGVRAAHRPGGALRLHPAGAWGRARALLARLGLLARGRFLLQPLAAPGLGTGVSTASLIAIARLADWQGPPEDLAQACIAVEGASDPLMFPAPERMLWASRAGVVLAPMPALPRYEVLGGFYGPPRRTDPADARFPDIADLVADWRGATDLSTFAALARESAARTLALRGPAGDPTAAVAREIGALGFLIAHTGAARGFVFAPGTVPDQAPAALCAAGLRGVIRFKGGGA